MSDIRAITKEECADIILGVQEPLIVCHVRPDGDTVGTAVALATVYKMLGRSATLACAFPIPDRLSFLLGDITVTDIYEGKTVITTDVASIGQIGDIWGKLPQIACSIDHHEASSPFAPNYTVGEASSCAEVLMDVIDVLTERGLIKMTASLAYPLYAAISSDTGCFCYSNVTPTTHKRAAELIGTGIDFADINHRLFHSKSEAQIRAESFVGSRIVSVLDGRVAYSCINAEDMKTLKLESEHFETAIDIVRSVRGVEIAFTVKETAEGEYKISLRSTDKAVADIALHFGGGGHSRAAGCSIKADSATVAVEFILEEIKKLFNE